MLKDRDGAIAVLRVTEDGALQRAGLSAGDVIIAVDGLKLGQAQLEARLSRAAVGERLSVHAFRRDELYCFDVELQAAEASTYVLEVRDAELARGGWLGV